MIVNETMEQGSEPWLLWRKKGIGATDAAACYGTSKWKTALDVYNDKLDLVKRTFEKTGRQEWGNRIEPLLVDKFMEEHGNDAHNLTRGGLYIDDIEPWRRCSLDASCRMGGCGCDYYSVIIECKTASSDDDWNPVPDGYYTQVQWQMLITGIKKAYFSVLVAGHDWFEREVDFDADYCADVLKACTTVWNCIETKTPPVLQNKLPDTEATAIAVLADTTEQTKSIELTKQDLAKYYLLKDAADNAVADFKKYKNELAMLMATGNNLTFEGKKFGYFVRRKGTITIDKAMLKHNWPDVYAAVCHTGASTTYPQFK